MGVQGPRFTQFICFVDGHVFQRFRRSLCAEEVIHININILALQHRGYESNTRFSYDINNNQSLCYTTAIPQTISQA